MSIYSPPILHLNKLNSTINVSDLESSDLNAKITISQANSLYLTKSGGSLTGPVSFSNTVSVPGITLTSNTNAQVSNQIGYYTAFNSALLNASFSNGTLLTPGFCAITLNAGVYMINYYYNLSCSASVTFTQIVSGISTNISSFNSQNTTTSSYISETVASGNNKYISGTYFVRPSFTATYYAHLLITYSTVGNMTANGIGINAIRIA
jgi:hypothetical protein